MHFSQAYKVGLCAWTTLLKALRWPRLISTILHAQAGARDMSTPPATGFVTPSPVGANAQPPPPQRGAGRAPPARGPTGKGRPGGATQAGEPGGYVPRKNASRMFPDSGTTLRCAPAGVLCSGEFIFCHAPVARTLLIA